VSPQQGAHISGQGNVLIQIAGNCNAVSIDTRPRLILHPPRGRSQSPLNSEIDILKAYNEAIPFIGRQPTFDLIWQWLRSPKAISIQVLTGGGGSGKTRLSIEVLRRMPAELPSAWQGGVIDHDELREIQGQLNFCDISWHCPTLMVLDYAASRVDALKTLIRKLCRAQLAGDSHPIRVLLLERFADPASGWLSEVIDQSFTWDTAALFEPVIKLPTFGDIAQRHELMRETVAAALPFHPGSSLAVPSLGVDHAFDEAISAAGLQDPLVVMMSALNAFSSDWQSAFSLGRTDLAMRFAHREADRISRFAPDSPSAAILKHMAAFATLCGGLTIDQAVSCADAELAALRAQYLGHAANLVRSLASALPGDAGISPVGPDIVGEAFVINILQDSFQDGIGTLRRSIQIKRNAVDFFIRALTDFHEPRHRAPRQWLDHLIEFARLASDEALLYAIERSIPQATTELREAAVHVSTALLQLAEAADTSSPAALNEVAKHQTSLANRLSELGQPHDALPHAEESLRIARGLCVLDPSAFRPILAIALNNLANVLRMVGRPDEAVDAISEAVSVHRELASARPEEFLPLLAASLTNLSNALVSVGRGRDALVPAEEAVSIYRRLTEARHGDFLPDLALALGNLANVLMHAQRPDRALGLAEESLGLYRQLAARRPDAFRPELARSLINVPVMYRAVGRNDDAFRALEEAVATFRQLAVAHPEAFHPSLAAALNNIANISCEAGRPADALPLAEEAIRLRRKLAAAHPDAFVPDLARSLATLARCYEFLGKPAEAAENYRESLLILAPFLDRSPDAYGDMAADFANCYVVSVDRIGVKMDEALINRIVGTLVKNEPGGGPSKWCPRT